MHPSLTRAFRIESLDQEPDAVMRDVFYQYAELIENRRAVVRLTSGVTEPDLRIGWLLWLYSLRQFLYFEERMEAPDPELYYARWNSRSPGGRLGSKNLWVYERSTDRKRYSVTTQAGGKIQPYFDVPSLNDPNLYVFMAQGEELSSGNVRVWMSNTTAAELRGAIGSRLDNASLSAAILIADVAMLALDLKTEIDHVIPMEVSQEAYARLITDFPGASDEMRFRALVTCVTQRA